MPGSASIRCQRDSRRSLHDPRLPTAQLSFGRMSILRSIYLFNIELHIAIPSENGIEVIAIVHTFCTGTSEGVEPSLDCLPR